MKYIVFLIIPFVGKLKCFYIPFLFIVSVFALKLVLFFFFFQSFFLHNFINVYACLTANLKKKLLEISFVYETILCLCCIEQLTTISQQEKDPETQPILISLYTCPLLVSLSILKSHKLCISLFHQLLLQLRGRS